MGTFNTLEAPVTCPRCGAALDPAEVACYFGETGYMERLRPGDRYPWRGNHAVHNGGRPEDGHCEGEGYCECPACGKDFFVRVRVRADRIEGVSPDDDRPGFIP